MNLKEIGYHGNFEDIDDFTMNCYQIIAQTFGACREAERKKQELAQKAKQGARRR